MDDEAFERAKWDNFNSSSQVRNAINYRFLIWITEYSCIFLLRSQMNFNKRAAGIICIDRWIQPIFYLNKKQLIFSRHIETGVSVTRKKKTKTPVVACVSFDVVKQWSDCIKKQRRRHSEGNLFQIIQNDGQETVLVSNFSFNHKHSNGELEKRLFFLMCKQTVEKSIPIPVYFWVWDYVLPSSSSGPHLGLTLKCSHTECCTLFISLSVKRAETECDEDKKSRFGCDECIHLAVHKVNEMNAWMMWIEKATERDNERVLEPLNINRFSIFIKGIRSSTSLRRSQAMCRCLCHGLVLLNALSQRALLLHSFF